MGVQDWTAAEAEAKRACAQWTAETPGGAVLGFDAESLFFAHAGGLESLATRAPFTPDSVLRYASVTKHVFASLVLSRPDVIGLDDPLGRHLPELQPALAAVTVGRALDMSGGIPDTRECLTLIGHSIFTETKAPELLAFHAAMERLNYPAGTEVSYSNGGYRLVEEALRRHGILFEDFVGSEIRDGLGLAMQAPEMWTDPVRGLVPGHWHDGAGWKLGLQGMHLSAAGSLSGSARALAGWGQALLRGEGSFAGRLAALSALRPLADGRMTGYGLGLRQSRLGQRYLVGHGGSQPGYKTYLLLDPQTRTGCVTVANRDDANTAAMALKVMAALLGESLPVAGSRLTPGLYVTESGADWLRLGPDTACRLDDEVPLYPANDGWADSQSASSRVRLHHEGAALVGEIGHAPRRYLPVAKGLSLPADLAGDWTCPAFGARLSISEGAVVMGAGPTRRAMPLTPLGAGRFLFTLQDGPWTKRICLNRLGPDRFELVLSRARMIEYRRA